METQACVSEIRKSDIGFWKNGYEIKQKSKRKQKQIKRNIKTY